jgi:hypothetical protein
VLTVGVMLALAFLGFTNFAHALPVNDKVLHFACFGLATAVFYFIVDVEECVGVLRGMGAGADGVQRGAQDLVLAACVAHVHGVRVPVLRWDPVRVRPGDAAGMSSV